MTSSRLIERPRAVEVIGERLRVSDHLCVNAQLSEALNLLVEPAFLGKRRVYKA